jgi:hypothetical protein
MVRPSLLIVTTGRLFLGGKLTSKENVVFKKAAEVRFEHM